MKDHHTSTFACQFGRHRYKKLSFGAASAGDMFQRKVSELFKDLPNVFGIVDDILVMRYDADGKDHDDTLQRVLQRCRQVNLKTKQSQMPFQMHISLIFGEVISRHGMKLTHESSKH